MKIAVFGTGYVGLVQGAVLADARYAVVGGNNSEGGYLATAHLLQAGARHIAFLGDLKYPEVKMRHAGYLRAHRELGIKPDKKLCSPHLYQAKEVAHTLGNWIDQKIAFDAVFATSDVAAANAIAALGMRNIRIPRQVQVVGYDDVPLSVQIHPQLSTVHQPINLAAEAMVELLRERMAGGPSRAVVQPTHLIRRSSTR